MNTKLSNDKLDHILSLGLSPAEESKVMKEAVKTKRYLRYRKEVRKGTIRNQVDQHMLKRVVNDLNFTGTLTVLGEDHKPVGLYWDCVRGQGDHDNNIEVHLHTEAEARAVQAARTDGTTAELLANLRAETESLLPPETVAKLRAKGDAGGHDTKGAQAEQAEQEQSKDIKDIEDIEDIDQGDQGDDTQGDHDDQDQVYHLPLAPLLTKDSREFLKAIQAAYESYVIALSFANKVGELPPEHAPLVLKTIADALSGNTGNHTGTDESTTAKHNRMAVTTAYKLLYTPASTIRKLRGSEATIIDKVSKL